MANGFVTSSPGSRHGDSDFGMSEWAVGEKFTCPGTGSQEITEIGLWCQQGTDSEKFRLAIYTDDASNVCPESQVSNSETAELDPLATTIQKVSHTYVTKPQVTSGVVYWLCILADVAIGKVDLITQTATSLRKVGITYPTWPVNSEWHSHLDLTNYDMGIYAVYQAAGGGVYEEVLSDLATSASSITDLQTFVNIVSDTIQSLSSLTDAQTYVQNLLSMLESTSVVSEVQAYLATLSSVAQSASSITDLQTYVESLQSVIQSASSIIDFIGYVETVQTVIVSSSSITDIAALIEVLLSTIQSQASLTDVQTYFESLLSTMTSLSAIEDKQSYVHNVLTLAQSQATIADIQSYIDQVQTVITSGSSVTDILSGTTLEDLLSTIVSQAGVYDYYKKADMEEAALLFYMQKRNIDFDFQSRQDFVFKKRETDFEVEPS